MICSSLFFSFNPAKNIEAMEKVLAIAPFTALHIPRVFGTDACLLYIFNNQNTIFDYHHEKYTGYISVKNGVDELCDLIKTNNTLTELDLSGNYIIHSLFEH